MATVPPFHLTQGTLPLLVSIPHVGTHVPEDIAERMTDVARTTPDTDWHLDLLYAFAREIGASVLQATHSRYVIDLNRPPDDASLYPGQNVTGLCPTDTFNSEPLYRNGSTPDATEIARRREALWRPYHMALQSEIARLRTLHDQVLLWDAHSIRSEVPRFFEGKLPDLNFGTADGKSCAEGTAQAICDEAQRHTAFSHVLNGRFKGGYITRHYGAPAQGVHAIQLEMAQCVYMNEAPPFDYRPNVAEKIQPVLMRLFEVALHAIAR